MKVYVRDYNPGAYAVTVACFGCGRVGQLAGMLIDAAGPPFRAYYCPRCLPVACIRWPNNDSSTVWEVERSVHDGSFTPLRKIEPKQSDLERGEERAS